MRHEEILECLEDGIDLEWFDGEYWFTLFKDSPIRIILENEIRRKI